VSGQTLQTCSKVTIILHTFKELSSTIKPAGGQSESTYTMPSSNLDQTSCDCQSVHIFLKFSLKLMNGFV
jgi:hypothetical protein